MESEDTSVKIRNERRNGLKLRAIMTRPKTDMRNLLDHILEQQGIELLTDKQLEEKIRQLEERGIIA